MTVNDFFLSVALFVLLAAGLFESWVLIFAGAALLMVGLTLRPGGA